MKLLTDSSHNHSLEAQFFTKSSKSIPRMGRRSDESMATNIQSRRALIDNLIDEYGPNNLLAALEAKKSNAAIADLLQGSNNEIAFNNDQPFDLNTNANAQYLNQQQQQQANDLSPTSSFSDVLYLNSPSYPSISNALNGEEHGLSYLVRRASNNQFIDGSSNSLAMRALNTERYLRHLASGQPLLSLNHVLTMNQKQQQQQQSNQQQHDSLFKEEQRATTD